ncbi:DUF3592 domain-containing protein [Aromatoleum buckelii]|uniref:DUF3592 domain-containing protein n=1 Tax=Aromatoleum buckelii TaxID=200254 RepID=A0ABX1N1E7_9RHOO|nr:DUF3592 domain-containing protein [Aromatoleum buckelii]MCK0510196.1 DUF3592 domain-containing protein [Aromatoleum buckelii]
MSPIRLLPSSPLAAFRAVALGIGLPLLGVGLLMAGLLGVVSYGVLPFMESLRSRHWQPVEAAIESVSLHAPPSSLHPPLDSVQIRYRYRVGDADHDGMRYDPHDGQYARDSSQSIVAGLQASPRITVWVNPSDPDDAMVFRELRWAVFLFTFPALALALAGGLMLFAGMLAWNQAKPGRRAGKPDQP